MQEKENFSGNIKLRLPKSLHAALVKQAEKEGVSLNQLCLMQLSTGLAQEYLGTEEFNRRLEKIEILCGSNEEMLFKELRKLNDEVEARKPLLLKELKEIFEKKSRSISEQMETLSFMYPLFYGRSKIPYLKMPSVKIVLYPCIYQVINYKEVEGLMSSISNTYVAYGDFDYYVPLERREFDRSRIMSLVISLCCEFKDLPDLTQRVKEKLEEAGYENKAQISIKPFFWYADLSSLLGEV